MKVAAISVLLPFAIAQAQDIRGMGAFPALGFPLTRMSKGNCVTNGGRNAVGYISSGYPYYENHAVSWTPEGGLKFLGDLPDGGPSYAEAISADGSTIVGQASGRLYSHAVIFPGDTGAIDLDNNPNRSSGATAVSGDGRVIGGFGATGSGRFRALVFSNPGIVDTFTPADSTGATFTDATSDGTYLIGNTKIPGTYVYARPFISAFGTSTMLGMLPTWREAFPTAVSEGAVVIVGQARNSSVDLVACAWTAFGGPVEVAAPVGYSNAGFSDVSADASVAVGIATDNTSGSAGGFAAMVLTTENGFEPLANYLTRHGVDLSNWELSEGLSVSQDGKTFGGNGYHRLPSGEVRPEAFIAIIEGQLPCTCAADFDQSGGTPDANDIDAFFLSWLYGDQSADVDCSGGTPDASDIDTFFQEWLAGGC